MEYSKVKVYPATKLTRFERARIIGARSLQIAMGAPILVDSIKDLTSPTEIAVAEFKKRAVPMTVVRRIEGREPITIDIASADLEEMWY